jgi:assimilatory nitrate reductase catalytic subunit
MRRIAVRGADGALAAALYVTRSGELPSRDWAAAQLGVANASPAELLAGRPSKPAPDRGPVVCVCHGVGEYEIAAAANAGAQTVATVGEATCAGTNCGSCRPAIARLLEAANALQAEAAE